VRWPRGPLAPGREIAPGYEVIEHLHRGKALDVYDAWSGERACRCVVKALRPSRVRDAKSRRHLLAEGRLLSSFTHPHIVRAYEVREEPVPLVVMETLVGETLAHMIEERGVRLTLEQLAQLGIHLGSAIRYLHAHGYLHLDLKPSNVIAECGRAKLIDLSIARPPGDAPAGIGTWCYLAPEQARGGELGPAADVWGIGVVLFEAATGKPAFDDDSQAGNDECPQLTQTVRRVEELRSLPRDFGDLVAACVEPEPARRPSVAELMAELESLARVPDGDRRHSQRRADS
jgi:eukaryotic-like serine/threonine-protein kinase